MENRYRDDFREEDFLQIEDPEVREQIKRVFTMENTTPKERFNFRKKMAIKKYQVDLLDEGSPAIQVAMMTEKVFHLVEEFKKSKRRDIVLFRKIQRILDKRSKAMEHLRINDYNRFVEIIRDYGLDLDPRQVRKWKVYKKQLPRYANGKGSKFS